MKRITAAIPMTFLAATCLAVALACGGMVVPAQAAPLEAADVAAGAKWLVHMDFDAGRTTKVGEYIREKLLKNEHVKQGLAKLHDELGMDPHKDLHGATLYGTTFTPHTGVLIVYATADNDKFMNHLKAKPGFIALKTADGKHDLYTWTEHRGAKNGGREHQHTVWASFPKHGMGMFADSVADLTAALAVIGGKGGLATNSPLLPKALKGTVLSGAVVGLTAANLPAHCPLAKQIDGISFTGGESDGEDFDHIEVKLTSAAVAKQVKSVVEGFQAMAALQLGNHPEAMKMVNGLKVEAMDKSLTIDWKASSDDVIKFGEKACEYIKEHHQEWHHGHDDGKAHTPSGK
jgi:hypothetical protein